MKLLLLAMLCSLVVPVSLRAELCGECKEKMFIQSLGTCKVCQGVTSSGGYKLCKQCSEKQGQCQACRVALTAKPAGEGKDEPPAKTVVPAKKKTYPAHWGEVPRIQTRDLRPLPGGYGTGSSTLAAWIQKHLDEDAKNPPAGGKKEANPIALEIQQVESKIAEKEELATRARFTPEGLKKFQEELTALKERLKVLKAGTNPK